ncbi:5-oxoprolinase subunit B family protein [Hansschlegelia plantiphila]|uniref:Allophanate hydrolase n=1 Tax=Hansschlegelia plantiphila TaxID=374655 RepID=A0A9W6MX96_9HYPH|nr:allophanate hydrolase subunit 1 [Hansschlegelia plantiphila]GLK69657.1 allophanate hydrolase [Hansschlegelia plantiphila]
MTEAPRFLDAGEAALVVEFGEIVDPAISDRVLALDAALSADPPDGLLELVPTYRSLMIHYDPLVIDREALVARAGEAAARASDGARPSVRAWLMPCCYDAELAEDLGEVAEALGLPAEEVVTRHAGADYRVAMYGFAPGFAYLGGLPETLAVPRRRTPRPPHPTGAVMVGGGLAAIATFPMPTGWHVVGRTPERLYAPERAEAFLLAPGDALRFEPVDVATFRALERRAATGEIVAQAASA